MVVSILELDGNDKKIISLLQQDPEMDFSVISKNTGLSEVAVEARIIKLKRKGLLVESVGINSKDMNDVQMASVELSTKKNKELLDKIGKCPFVLHAFNKSGKNNIGLTMIGPDTDTIYNVINQCFRKELGIKKIKMDMIITPLKDFIIPVDFEIENFDINLCRFRCKGKYTKEENIKSYMGNTNEIIPQKIVEELS